MHSFVRSLITEWRKLELPIAGEKVVVAVSGGADSLGLLLAIDSLREAKKLDLRVVAAHFNHRLRGRESEADEEFIRQIAVERGFELAIGRDSIARKGNLEQNARLARYEFLRATAESLRCGYVLTAHTVNDQAETFLLNLLRGSGIDGLSGMRPVREIGQGTGEKRPESRESDNMLPFEPAPDSYLLSPVSLVRPLLRWATRADTENFCQESGVEFRYDTMNEDMSFKRVRVRKMLLPMMREFNPAIIETLARTAEMMQGVSPPLPETPASVPEELQIKDLKGLEAATLRETLRAWLKARRGSLRAVTSKHIHAIEQLITSTKSGKMVEIPGFGLVRKRGGRLRFENIKVDK